ncbi:hypothetical protein M8J77_001911 [Diaphorina citri]|nr:hypothetical protein M8J77_001911 [Diaphorina citri]
MDHGRLSCGILFLLFAVFTLKDIFVMSSSSSEKQIPLTKVGLASNIGPTLKFFYCYSCGYRKAFEEYQMVLTQKYPIITVLGDNFDPPFLHLVFAKFLSVAKILLIATIIGGLNPFQFIGCNLPRWFEWCQANKFYACMMIFFCCNAIESTLISTGAFEILFNDMPIWSKLETGRIPQPNELFQIIDSHLGFGKKPGDIDMFDNIPT